MLSLEGIVTLAMMFVRLYVRSSVCLSGTGVHCEYTVHFSAYTWKISGAWMYRT